MEWKQILLKVECKMNYDVESNILLIIWAAKYITT